MLAHHRETGTPVAIKYLHDRVGKTALRAEAEVLSRIGSPHITRLYEYVEGAEGSAIVMELVDGIALRDLLRAEGATTAQAALVGLKGSLLGLAAAHEAGVVHRDYKPANVLVDTAGTSKLVDFGIAVESGEDRDVSGTPAYMPPEQWAGRPASPAGDKRLAWLLKITEEHALKLYRETRRAVRHRQIAQDAARTTVGDADQLHRDAFGTAA